MATIYLSYARDNGDDVAFAQEIRKILNSRHEIVEFEGNPNKLSADDISKINSEVAAAFKLVFIFSSEAYASHLCYIELQAALQSTTRWEGWRRVKEPAHKVVPVSWRSTAAPINTIMTLIEAQPEAWASVDKSTLEQSIKKVRDTVNNYDWVNYHLYREAAAKGDIAEIEAINVKQRQELYNAVDEPLRTWLAFLSYARKNNDFIKPFKAELQKVAQIWFDEEDIAPAKAWLEEIYNGIERSHNFLFVVSTEWLMSPNCRKEYDYALQFNKRLIPVIYDGFDEAKCRAHLAKFPWYDGEVEVSPDIVIEKAQEVMAYIQSLPERYVIKVTDPKALVPLVGRIQDCWHDELAAYISFHTDLLIQARQQNFLRGKKLYEARAWYQQHKDTAAYPPSETHRQFIEQSWQRARNIRLTWITAISVITTVILALSAFSYWRSLQLAESERDAETARAEAQEVRANSLAEIAAEANRRLQVQAIYNSIHTFELQSRPTQFTMAANSLWVALADNRVTQITHNGLYINPAIATGSAPDTFVEGFGYLWLNNRGDGALTRIDGQSGVSKTIAIGRTPAPAVMTSEAVWVRAIQSEQLYAINPQTLEPLGEPYPIGLNAVSPFSSGSTLWYLGNERNQLFYIDGPEAEAVVITLPDDGEQAFYHEASNSIVVLASAEIYLVDATSRELRQTHPLAGRVQGLVQQGDYLWGYFLDGRGILRFNPTLAPEIIPIDGVLDIALTDGRLWAFTADSVRLIETDTLRLIAMLDNIPNVRQLRHPVSDGLRAWLSQSESGMVYVIDEASGELVRDLPLCEELSRPIFDGASMWFACPLDQTMIAVPADIYFLGESTVLTDTEPHAPLILDDVLWLSQAGTGRIIAFDMQTRREIWVGDMGAPILALTADAPYIWTAIYDGNEFIRIDARQLQRDALEQPKTLVERRPIDHNIASLDVISDRIWLNSLTIGDSSFLTIINRETLETYDDTNRASISGGLTYDGTAVWTSTLEVEQGYIRWLDPLTGAIVDEKPMPITPFAAYEPLQYEGVMWFAAVIPPPLKMQSVLAQLSNPERYDEIMPFYLIGLDAVSHKLVHSYPLPTWTGYPQPQGRLFWFRLEAKDITLRQTALEVGNGIIAVDIDSGDLVGGWSVCEYDSSPYVIGNYVWLGCRDVDDSFGVIVADQTNLIHYYDGVGMSPNYPLLLGNRVIFTFEASDTGAIFDADSGALLQQFMVGADPQQPFVHDDTIWVYNNGSDTLQRIGVIE